MDPKMIICKNVSAWYGLIIDEKMTIVGLRIHEDFIKSNKVDFNKDLRVKYLMEKLSLPKFGENFDSNIGFGGVLKRRGRKDGFIEFTAEIPEVKQKTDKKCSACDGTKVRKHDTEEKCTFCYGTGLEWIMDWEKAKEISASFTVLTEWLRFCEIETFAGFPQLLSVQTSTKEGDNGGAISGDISIPMYEWLKSLGDRYELVEVVEAMKVVYKRMYGMRNSNQYRFNAYAASGKFIISCPGNACSLIPSDWNKNKGQGFEFDSHNADNPMQQIIFLVALAVLQNMARKGIK